MLATPFRSAKALAADIRKKKIGCRELLDLYLERVEKHNPEINAIIAMDVEGARKRAQAADRALGRKQVWGPLHGVPMTIKESYDVVGMPTTWGVPELKDNFPPRNALAVDRLLGAGVVLFGKTNVPIYLADYQSYNAIYGTTNNPWDLSRSPGGSSGGSGGRPRRRTHRHRGGERHRLLHPQPCPLLWRVRSQAHVGRGAAPRPGAARPAVPDGHLGDRADGAGRRRSRDRPRRHGGTGRDRRRRLQAHAGRTPPEVAA
jgi:hypothetical protein